jgi:pimeloyl-ACP methyl ester carboxylesterase
VTPPRVTWHRTRVDGRAAAYLEAGEGRPVVFLHGWGLSHRAYRDPVRRLASLGVRVLAPALPGFSGSAGFADPDCSLRSYSDWVAGFLDAVDVHEPVLLVGHSFGGGVATLVAHDHPRRVGALVLVNAIGGGAWSDKGELVRPMTARPLWDWGIHFSRDFRSAKSLSRVLPVVLSEAVPNFVLDPRAFVRSARLARSADLTAELGALQRRGLPVVVVWARRDGVLTDASLDSLRDALGDADAIEVAGGHNWLLADPKSFGEVMTNVVEVAERARWLEPKGPGRRAWRRVRARLPGRARVSVAVDQPGGE